MTEHLMAALPNKIRTLATGVVGRPVCYRVAWSGNCWSNHAEYAQAECMARRMSEVCGEAYLGEYHDDGAGDGTRTLVNLEFFEDGDRRNLP